MQRIVEVVVDLKRKIYNTIFLKQMDTTIIKVKLLNENIITDLNEQTVDIIFTKPDNTIVQQIATEINKEEAIATIPLQADCVRQHGIAKMEIEVKKTNSEVISSFYIPVQIEKTSKENVNSKNTPNYFEEFAKGIDEFKKDSSELLQNIEEAETKRAEEFKEMKSNMRNIVLGQVEVVTVKEAIPANTEYEIPFSYTVGSNELEVKWLGWSCTKDVNYAEVGEPGAESNKVKFGWQIEPNETLEFRKRG